jgi:hypothetical protein
MKVIVTKHVNFHRPGTPITFEVPAKTYPQILPRDVRDHVIATGAGYLVEHEPGQRDGGVAALIARKQRSA